MPLNSLHHYHTEVERLIHFGGTANETSIRNAFYSLLNDYARQRGLMEAVVCKLYANKNQSLTNYLVNP